MNRFTAWLIPLGFSLLTDGSRDLGKFHLYDNGLIERAQSTVPAFTYSRKRASD